METVNVVNAAVARKTEAAKQDPALVIIVSHGERVRTTSAEMEQLLDPAEEER